MASEESILFNKDDKPPKGFEKFFKKKENREKDKKSMFKYH